MSVSVCEIWFCMFRVLVSVCACLRSCACSVMASSVNVQVRKARCVIQWRLGVFLTFRCR